MIQRYMNNPNDTIKNDFIGPIGFYDYIFFTGAPPIITWGMGKDFTLIKPFEPVVWAFILASLVSVSLSLMVINKMHSIWSSESIKESPFQSINIKEKLEYWNNIN